MMENNVLTELEPGVLKGVQTPTIEKILAAGIHTVADLANLIPSELAERGGMGKDTAENAIRKALEYVRLGYVTGKQLHDELKKRTRLTTGSLALDELLGGGIESETTTEIIGKNGAGKTQICHTLAVLAQLPIEEGGLAGKVAWIDTEDTFRPDRIEQIATSLSLDVDEILNGILRRKAITTLDQMMAVEELSELFRTSNIKLVIVDSMMSHLRSEYIGRGTLSERQGILNRILHKLSKLSQTWKLTTVYTNQVMDNPGIMYGNPERAVGGHIMGHAATTRFHIKKSSAGACIATMVKSPSLADGQAPFIIDEYGIRDTAAERKRREKEKENEEKQDEN